jgi:glucose/arabinose dehydrogenase
MKQLFLAIFFFATMLSYGQYTVTNFITGLPYPVSFAISADTSYYITLKGGDGFSSTTNAKVNIYNKNGVLQGTLWDFTDSTETYFERGVLGVAIDPDFDNNHYVYVFYNHDAPAKIRVVRFTQVGFTGTNPTIIFEYNDPFSAGNHTGGNIHFRPSEPDKLYIALGDRATSSNAQLLTNPCGKMLRINTDGTIPTDNPFYDDGNPATGNDDRIWTYGNRNPFDFTFSTINDSLYISENGQNTWDEVNYGVKGANYGWPTCEGFYLQGSTTSLCTNPSYSLPIDDWSAPLPAVTGIVIYDHPLMTEFQGHMLVVDYDNGDITDIGLGSAELDSAISRQVVNINLGTLDQLTDINVGPEGCLYVVHGGYTGSGMIRKICPTGMSVAEENEAVKFLAYPNPAETLLSIDLTGIPAGALIEIVDITGRVVYTGTSVNHLMQLDISSFADGAYVVSVVSEGKRGTQLLNIH